MLKLLESMKQLYVCCGYVDMRKGIEGLAAVVQIKYGKPIEEGSLFLFCGRKADRFKGLFWDSNGYVMLYKRLSNGRLQWPRNKEELAQITPQQFRWLMEGLSIYPQKSIRNTKPGILF